MEGTPDLSALFDIRAECCLIENPILKKLYFPALTGQVYGTKLKSLLKKDKATISNQLGDLTKIGFLKGEKEGRKVLYTFDPTGNFMKKLVYNEVFPILLPPGEHVGRNVFLSENITDIDMLLDEFMSNPYFFVSWASLFGHDRAVVESRGIYEKKKYSAADRKAYGEIFDSDPISFLKMRNFLKSLLGVYLPHYEIHQIQRMEIELKSDPTLGLDLEQLIIDRGGNEKAALLDMMDVCSRLGDHIREFNGIPLEFE